MQADLSHAPAYRRPLRFFKYHGCKNDFIIIDGAASGLPLPRLSPQEVVEMCDRRAGIGADQVLVIERSDGPNHYQITIWNSDGTGAAMCGNGLRCVARHIFEFHDALHTTALLKIGEFTYESAVALNSSRGFASASVHLGTPTQLSFCFSSISAPHQPAPQGIALPQGPLAAAFIVAGVQPRVMGVNLGNPHAVLFAAADLAQAPMHAMEELSRSSWFSGGINVHVASVRSRKRVRIWSYERGAGPTLACGSGACAVVVAGVSSGLLARHCSVEMDGGEVQVTLTPSNTLLLSGPAERIFEGVWPGKAPYTTAQELPV